MLTIGRLADFAGVTIRAVRHYHARGLLPEPERDASGYRRYNAQAVVDLIRIKTLADAGVPLARVRDLLHAEPEEFAAATRQIDRQLQADIRRLQQHRRRVAELASGDGLTLPPGIVAYLARLREIGISERVVGIERDGWILLAAHAPDRVEEWIRLKHAALDDDAFRNMYRDFDAAQDWPPDDPRLERLADDIVAYMHKMVERPELQLRPEPTVDATTAGLLDSHTIKASPAWRRLERSLIERGLGELTSVQQADQ